MNRELANLGAPGCRHSATHRDAYAGRELTNATGDSRGLETIRPITTVTASSCHGLALPQSHHSPPCQYPTSGGFWPSTTQ
jgi:hypothetical protein